MIIKISSFELAQVSIALLEILTEIAGEKFSISNLLNEKFSFRSIFLNHSKVQEAFSH